MVGWSVNINKSATKGLIFTKVFSQLTPNNLEYSNNSLCNHASVHGSLRQFDGKTQMCLPLFRAVGAGGGLYGG